MKILITGGTGFIGRYLTQQLLHDNHDIVVLTRNASRVTKPMQAITKLSQLSNDMVFDAVINLAGEPIADKKWTDKRKQAIRDSRIGITQALVEYCQRAETKPSVFISGSAIGYYGISGSLDDALIDESAAGDNSFSSELCQDWEAAASAVESLGIRTCYIRTGIVLGNNGGALAKMLLPFKLGLGGKIGTGKQWMPWIHMTDMVNVLLYALHNNHVEGAVNAVAPNPVTNAIFSKSLASSLNRPSIFPMPAFVIKMLMGQMGEELLLSGKKVVPKKLQDLGFDFQFETIDQAFNHLN